MGHAKNVGALLFCFIFTTIDFLKVLEEKNNVPRPKRFSEKQPYENLLCFVAFCKMLRFTRKSAPLIIDTNTVSWDL